MKPKAKKIFILLSGLGLGNATRQVAILEEVFARDPGAEVHVFTWGNGYRLLRSYQERFSFSLVPLIPYSLRKIKWSYSAAMIASAFVFALFYPVNSLILLGYRLRLSPELVVFDSDYHFLSFLFGKPRRLFLGQAADVWRRSRAYSLKDLWANKMLFSSLIERMDFFVQTFFCHHVFVPVFKNTTASSRGKKTTEIPLIVRKSFLKAGEAGNNDGPAVLMGGSTLDSNTLVLFAKKNKIPIFQFDPKNESTAFQISTSLKNHNPIIIQGGLSSISEVLALGKELVILPISGHLEQFLNLKGLQALRLATDFDTYKAHSLPPPMNEPRTQINTSGAEAFVKEMNGYLS